MAWVVTAGSSISTRNIPMPLPPDPGSVCAMTIATSACTACVIEVFSPAIRQPPSTRVARVERFAASDPAPGSVSARQMTASPAIPRVTHRCELRRCRVRRAEHC